jgi:hypothetical protein
VHGASLWVGNERPYLTRRVCRQNEEDALAPLQGCSQHTEAELNLLN